MSKANLQVISCKAAVCWGEGEGLVIEEIQVEPPQALEVRVKMICASLCHTDILCWTGYPLALFPRVLGHEGAGVVESVGEGVTELKEGDLVIPTCIGECKECENCCSGKTNLCLNFPTLYHGLMLDNSSRMSVKGQRLYHLFTCSTWSEYTVINVNYVVKIDPRVPPPQASLLSCAFSTGFGATWKEAKVERGSSVAVFGLGSVGLGVVEGARIRGASKIIGVDLNEKKRETGEVFGMTDFIEPGASDKSVAEEIREITGGMGVDYSFECTGVASLINESLESTALGRGVAVIIGTSQEVTALISLTSLICGRTLKGSIFGGIKPKSDLQSIIDKCINEELHLDALVTHEIQLEEINQAFELLKQPDCVKVVIMI
ncbi:8-hydroxygeraniol oxidoreductase-like [Macadamia integrifolia]|uniref:8-hydroxygeraniol oxidoreductase-like n=1 Tax=Macadamia integrifolia TaxID=60698 RepID=UPI001C4ECEB8|nr:8-hydroxygeraniol oxidoreductase-like [Macadamia integrifolia]